MTDPTSPPSDDPVEAVFDGVESGPKELLTVNDAELLAVDGPEANRVVPLLSLAGASPETIADSPDPNERLKDPFVQTVLGLRRTWSGILAFDQRTAESSEFLALYLRADQRALAEFASGDGRHRFTALTAAAALDSMVDLLTPLPATADVDGDARTYSQAEWESPDGASMAGARVVSVVVGVRNRILEDGTHRAAERRLTVYNFLDRTEVLLPQGHRTVTVAPVSGTTLRTHLINLLELSSHEKG